MSKGKITFEPIESSNEAHRILQDCARSTALAQLFTRQQKTVVNCRFVRLNLESGEVGFRPEQAAELKSFLEELTESKSRDCFVNLVNDRVKVFFKSRIRGLNEGRIMLDYPQALFRVQRREHLRFKIPMGHTLRVEVASTVDRARSFQNKVVDISAGGLAFYAKLNQEADFQAGQIITSMRFTLNRRVVICQGEIRHVRSAKVEGEDLLVIGVLFYKMGEEDRDWVSLYVRQQTRNILSKML